jgi:quercetin dioxygenase-like cupin family protein
MARKEVMTRGNCSPSRDVAPGVELRVFVSGAIGAERLSTGTATFQPAAELPYHAHPFSEAITVLEGEAQIVVEGRRYQVRPYDSMHLPAGTAHMVRSVRPDGRSVLHWAFATDTPSRELVADTFAVVDRAETDDGCPEHLTRFDGAPIYELAPRACFRDLFAGRFGSRGICGGYGIFEPGASLPCHFHGYDESITIVAGEAICQVAGQEYPVSGYDTACVPRGRPHRFINRSGGPMAMVWVYAGDEPDRTVVDVGYCERVIPLSSLGG